jgi:hypothetical protein
MLYADRGQAIAPLIQKLNGKITIAETAVCGTGDLQKMSQTR